ncbi:MAG TPA: hypothetical protein IAA32_01035 [Candidatus Butyricicoccus stercorigallinarum]|nr:hypothetical protein [Candidatus Butyricicoccus stercorigallinarum]
MQEIKRLLRGGHLSAELCRPQAAVRIVFSGDRRVGKNTAQPANVRAQRVRCRGLHLLKKTLAFF